MSDFHQIMNAVKEFHQTFGLDFQESPKPISAIEPSSCVTV